MKFAGKARSKSSFDPGACGNPHCAKGMLPESNHASITSVTRRISAPHWGQGRVTSSIHGLCTMRCSFSVGSASRAARKASNARGFSRSISAADAGATWCASSAEQIQTLSGVPQNRSRDSAQSTLFARKSPNRPLWMCSGSHRIAWLFAIAFWMLSRVRMYQAGRASWISGSSSARQQNGYSCRYFSSCTSSPRAARSLSSLGSASLTHAPARSPISSESVPSARTTVISGTEPGSAYRPSSARCASKSSSPNAGATCTIPVPASSVTNCAPSTRQ